MKSLPKLNILVAVVLGTAVALFIGGITLFPLLLFSFGDILSEPIVDRTYLVKKYRIRERVYHRSNWPDNVYERIYTLENGWQSIELGKFQNEDNLGIESEKVAPKLVGEWLAIFSANRIFLWKPESKSLEFEPFQAQGWTEYAENFDSINGHYDYQSANFSTHGDRWLLEYRCRQNCADPVTNRSKPAKIVFVSSDRGKTFQILKDR